MESPTETKAHSKREPCDGAGPGFGACSLRASQKGGGVPGQRANFRPVGFHPEAFSVIFEICFKNHNGKRAEGRALRS